MAKKSSLKPIPEQAKDIFANYSPQKSSRDTGSPESQIALFTFRIQKLTIHLKSHKKDKSALQRGLKKMVGKRKRFLSYLAREDRARYQHICEALSIKGLR